MTHNLFDTYKRIGIEHIQENYNDALFYYEEIMKLFHSGIISLREKARAENLYWNIVYKISLLIKTIRRVPLDLEDIGDQIRDVYYCNFSLLLSLPDSWAINRLFPIMPIHRLNEEPTRPAIISDITCDSDRKIDKFIDFYDVKNSLLLHELKTKEEYYLGVFMVGAYQKLLVIFTILWGGTNVVTIRINSDAVMILPENLKEILWPMSFLMWSTIRNG